MIKRFIKILLLALSILLILTACDQKQNEKEYIKIGGGEIQDIYNPAAKIIVRIINSSYNLDGYFAESIQTLGSLDNIKQILNGDLDIALASQVSAYAVYYGIDKYKEIKDRTKLRSIISLFDEYLFLIVLKDSQIYKISDVAGKEFGGSRIGKSATNQLSIDITNYFKSPLDTKNIHRNNLDESINELEEHKIDGLINFTAQPNPSIYAIMHSRKVSPRFLNMEDDLFNYFKKKYPFIRMGKITKKMYPNSSNKGDVNTLVARALIVCGQEDDEELIYYITKDIFENFTAFKSVHQSFEEITPRKMVENLTIPIHPGALKYYKEKHLDKYIPKNLLPKKNK